MKKILLIIAILTLLVCAAYVMPERGEEVIAGIVAFLIMLLGPKPLKTIFDALNVPTGAWRVIAVYVVSGVVGFVALAMCGAITSVPADVEDVLALAGILMAGAQAAYHRLKDLGRLSQ